MRLLSYPNVLGWWLGKNISLRAPPRQDCETGCKGSY
ncbi:hypothetical protein ABES80_22695 [Bacillus gobiensis]